MIIVHQPKNGMVQVETESVTDDLQATGSHQLSLSRSAILKFESYQAALSSL